MFYYIYLVVPFFINNTHILYLTHSFFCHSRKRGFNTLKNLGYHYIRLVKLHDFY